mgnify:CR=1 FL=1
MIELEGYQGYDNYEGTLVREPRSWLDQMDWAGLRQEVESETRAQIALLGLGHAGKSSLFNSLRGWPVSLTPPELGREVQPQTHAVEEQMGLFTLIDLPEDGDLDPGLLERFDQSALLVYLLDGAVDCSGDDPAAAIVRPADVRWIGQLRATGRPLMVVLNKADVWADRSEDVAAALGRRLGTEILPVSAYDSSDARRCFLERMVETCPDLAVPLGRELADFRHDLAQHLIRRASLLCGLVAVEPVPLVDLPVHVGTQVGLVARIGAIYDRPPASDYSKELVCTGAGSAALRLLAQQAAKAVPVLGWAVSGLLAAAATWLVGQTALAYFEGRATPDNFRSLLTWLWHERLRPFCTRALHTYLRFCPAVWVLRYARESRQQLRDADHHNPEPETPNLKRDA